MGKSHRQQSGASLDASGDGNVSFDEFANWVKSGVGGRPLVDCEHVLFLLQTKVMLCGSDASEERSRKRKLSWHQATVMAWRRPSTTSAPWRETVTFPSFNCLSHLILRRGRTSRVGWNQLSEALRGPGHFTFTVGITNTSIRILYGFTLVSIIIVIVVIVVVIVIVTTATKMTVRK